MKQELGWCSCFRGWRNFFRHPYFRARSFRPRSVHLLRVCFWVSVAGEFTYRRSQTLGDTLPQVFIGSGLVILDSLYHSSASLLYLLSIIRKLNIEHIVKNNWPSLFRYLSILRWRLCWASNQQHSMEVTKTQTGRDQQTGNRSALLLYPFRLFKLLPGALYNVSIVFQRSTIKHIN